MAASPNTELGKENWPSQSGFSKRVKKKEARGREEEREGGKEKGRKREGKMGGKETLTRCGSSAAGAPHPIEDY